MTLERSYPSGSLLFASPLTRRLARLWPLEAADCKALEDLVRDSEWVGPDVALLKAGDDPDVVIALLDGLAYEHQDFAAGRRQITGLRFPGDLCDGHFALSGPVDYGVLTLTRSRISRIPVDRFVRRLERRPAIAQALQLAAAREEVILRAWMANLGQRPAYERLAHLICEVAQRMASRGLLFANGGFELPLTQQELGWALGLTSVHVNRVLRRLRDEGLIEVRSGLVQPRDLERLQTVAGFDPSYLD
ncbi:MAG TPA: Crp/Fnr family transcriptional regulator [Caulobacteraceae bacterium]|jgi:CRP-like cAMP-binding protein|nr:Crp/Fnr family transcriptional regulator [Caulobacteraceae bacterium]